MALVQVRFRSDRLFESEEQAEVRKQKAREHQQELEQQIEAKRTEKVIWQETVWPAEGGCKPLTYDWIDLLLVYSHGGKRVGVGEIIHD